MGQKELQRLKEAVRAKDIKKKHDFLRVISGTGRFRILVLLHERPDGLKVTEIAKVLQASTSRISHQMRILRKNGLVSAAPNGREKIYRSRINAACGIF